MELRSIWAELHKGGNTEPAEAIVQPRGRHRPKTSPFTRSPSSITHRYRRILQCWAQPGTRLQLHQGSRNKATNSQDTFFCVDKDLDLPAATPASGACWRLWTSPKPLPRGSMGKGELHGMALPAQLHGQDQAHQKQQVGAGIAEATPSLLPPAPCCQHPAAGLQGSKGDGGAGQQEELGACSETWKTTSPGAARREPLAAPQKPHAGAHRHHFSQGQAARAQQGRSRRMPSPRLAAARAPAHTEGYRSKPPALAQAQHRRGLLPLLPFQRESCRLVGSEKAAVLSPCSRSWIHL